MASYSSWLNVIPLPAMEGDSNVLQFIGRWSYEIYEEREMIMMYIHLLFSALFPIYIGSHSSLRCPPSALDPTKKKATAKGEDEDEDEDIIDEIEAQNTLSGLTPYDAILFPVIASITLCGLYLLIKWLDDPTLLNRILGYYCSLLGIFGVGKLAGDALGVLTTAIFPSIWSSGREVYYVDFPLSQQFTNAATTGGVYQGPINNRKFTNKTNPLPGSASAIKFPDKVNRLLWSARGYFRRHWIFRCYVHGITNAKAKVRLNDVIGLSYGLVAIVLYNTNGRAWWLTNLMGFGFCYGTIQLMSPTTFWTGTLILAGLFIYDIVMVFYTPLMITVATSLDVPIKLVFPGPKHGGMLGLGDIVLPGIIMALALRFDLYLHYLRKPSPRTISHSLTPSSIPKPTYKPATGRWGERFWTWSLPNSAIPSELAGVLFSKVYFYASVIGYVVGMITTLVVLNIFHHAQPALLYLVPGVLIALWGTALCRGELHLMWNYTEFEADDEEQGETDGKESRDVEAEKEEGKKGKHLHKDHAHHVFLLSLSLPRHGSK